MSTVGDSADPSQFANESAIACDLKLVCEHPENRFDKQFVPTPNHNDTDLFAYECLKALSRQLKITVVPEKSYKQIDVPSRNRFKFPIDSDAKHESSEKQKITQEMFEDPSAVSPKSRKGVANDTDPLSPRSLVDAKRLAKVTAKLLSSRLGSEGEQEGGLFWRYQPDFVFQGTPEDRISQRKQFPIWRRRFHNQILVSCKKLAMGLGSIEPFFARLALYDLENQARISEFFHFDLNTGDVLTGTLHEDREKADHITCCRHALFSMDDRNPSIYLVIHIDKVLQGDPEAAAAPYLADKTRNIDTLGRKVRHTINRLHKFHQDFGWGMVKLFDDYGNLRFEESDAVVDEIFFKKPSMSEEEFIQMISDVAKDNSHAIRQR
eukprot:83544_1